MGLEEISFDESIKTFDRIGVAYSGGLDSTVLLHLLTQKKEFKDKIDAIHVNHSISQDSDKWEEFCRENAKQLDVDFFSYKVDGKNLSEADLRILRYKKFKEEWARYLNNNILLTAHHADDQAETIFFRFMRGTGLNGLKGIPAWGYTGRSDDDYKVVLHRPLLNVQNKDKVLEEIMLKREKKYEALCKSEVITDNQTIQDNCNQIMEIINVQ